MTLYRSYYEQARTHLALDKDAPIPRRVMPPSEGASWRSLKSAAFTIAMNAAWPEPAER